MKTTPTTDTKPDITVVALRNIQLTTRGFEFNADHDTWAHPKATIHRQSVESYSEEQFDDFLAIIDNK